MTRLVGANPFSKMKRKRLSDEEPGRAVPRPCYMNKASALLITAPRPLTLARMRRAMAAATLPFTCPNGYLSGGEAFEQACAVLIPAPADAAEAVSRIAAITDADVGLRRGTFTAVDPDEEARRLTHEDVYNACRRSVETLMRNALADRRLTPYGRGPTGEMERLDAENSEVWRREGLLPGLDSVPDDILSPGPDMKGKPFFLKLSELHDCLASLQHELGGGQTPEPSTPVAEPAAVAGAAESLPDTVSAADDIESTRWQREPVIRVMKRFYPLDGVRPKGVSIARLTARINREPEFRDKNVSEDTVRLADIDIKDALKK